MYLGGSSDPGVEGMPYTIACIHVQYTLTPLGRVLCSFLLSFASHFYWLSKGSPLFCWTGEWLFDPHTQVKKGLRKTNMYRSCIGSVCKVNGQKITCDSLYTPGTTQTSPLHVTDGGGGVCGDLNTLKGTLSLCGKIGLNLLFTRKVTIYNYLVSRLVPMAPGEQPTPLEWNKPFSFPLNSSSPAVDAWEIQNREFYFCWNWHQHGNKLLTQIFPFLVPIFPHPENVIGAAIFWQGLANFGTHSGLKKLAPGVRRIPNVVSFWHKTSERLKSCESKDVFIWSEKNYFAWSWTKSGISVPYVCSWKTDSMCTCWLGWKNSQWKNSAQKLMFHVWHAFEQYIGEFSQIRELMHGVSVKRRVKRRAWKGGVFWNFWRHSGISHFATRRSNAVLSKSKFEFP